MDTLMYINGKPFDMKKEIEDTEKDLKKDEIGFTYVHKAGVLSMFGLKDFLTQVKKFEKAGMKYVDGNQYEKEINGNQYIMIVFTPKNNSEQYMCPLALELKVMVCGFTYLLRKDKINDKVLEEIKRKMR